MFTLKGANGIARFSQNKDTGNRATSRYMSLSTGVSLDFFKKVSILKTDLTNNSYGLFSFRNAKGKNKVRFASLSAPKHLLSSRKSGCGWNPKGKVTMNTDSIDVCPVEYNGEQCPDEFYGECLETIFGANSMNDLFASSEGKALFNELVSLIYIGLGNSFYDLVWYGQHPLIEKADLNEWYAINPDEWEDYKDQQDACGGIMTMIDSLKEDGVPNFNVPISVNNISSDGTTYIGDPTELFDSMIKAQSPTMKVQSRNNAKAVLLVDSRIFEAYEDKLTAQWTSIPDAFFYKMNGAFCSKNGCTSDYVDGVLKYKGYLVVSMPEWDSFNQMTGTNTFRAILTSRGNFGIAYDVPKIQGLDQFGGFGLNITQHLEAPYKGQIFMDTAFKVGAGILDKDYMVNASLVLLPE